MCIIVYKGSVKMFYDFMDLIYTYANVVIMIGFIILFIICLMLYRNVKNEIKESRRTWDKNKYSKY